MRFSGTAREGNRPARRRGEAVGGRQTDARRTDERTDGLGAREGGDGDARRRPNVEFDGSFASTRLDASRDMSTTTEDDATMTTRRERDADDGEAEGRRPRLAIKKMVLENFKSYAGAQHVGPFHKVRTSRCVRRSSRIDSDAEARD